MQKLQILIDRLTKTCGLHISIVDLSGILNTPMTQIGFHNVIHATRFCDIAKSTDRGYRTCLRCKMLANTKAISERRPFLGQCVYGLCEAAFPVVINGSVAAVVYVGNAVVDKDRTAARMEKTCGYTGVDAYKLSEELKHCETVEGPTELLQVAELVADYLTWLYHNAPAKTEKLHWLVSLMKRHADEMYCTNISLKELAVTCQKNEKYLGRLFKKEMGIGFNEYCTQLRLHKAEKRLLQSDDKIIDIAFDCGFNTISYFNRVFKKKHGMPPKTYRAQR